MSEVNQHPIIPSFAKDAIIDEERYSAEYQSSIDDPDKYWAEQAEKFIDWYKPWDKVSDVDFHQAKISWFEGAELNVSYNCIDRHLKEKANQTAIIFEGDEPGTHRNISYQELHDEVCRFANVLKKRGVKKGDRVCIYMPMIPEVGYAMLACARIGAVHSVVFGGFSPEALKTRILDSDCRVVITADEGVRGGKKIPLKANTDKAVSGCEKVHSVIVIKHTKANVAWNDELDVDYWQMRELAEPTCEPEVMGAEDPLFILYTSGSTGTPKGVLHTSGGYLLYAAITHKYVFDYKEGDIYWCTADAGWVTGHSYIFYGPLANGATTLVFEGVPTYPSVSRFWNVVDEHKVTIFYTAPTALRALMAQGNEAVTSTSRASLRLLGTVGEPINPEAWEWYFKIVGESRCPIVDTWWQTETGGIMITPLAGAHDLKPGAASKPFFGIQPKLLDNDGNQLDGEASGSLALNQSWPGQMRGVYGDQKRFFDTYFSQFAGYYFTGGRMDDVLNVSGHRLGTAEIESALVLHPKVAEAAVVGFPHPIKGEAIYAYVTLMNGETTSDELRSELKQFVGTEIGAIARPERIQWAPGLPKTRSGKIMRRILRKIASKEFGQLGDISTLADPSVAEDLIENR